MNIEYKYYCDWVLILSMSSMTVKSNKKMINYIDLDLRKEVIFFLALNFKENYTSGPWL